MSDKQNINVLKLHYPTIHGLIYINIHAYAKVSFPTGEIKEVAAYLREQTGKEVIKNEWHT